MLCIVYSTIRYLPAHAPAPQPWQFDLWSALIGAAVALLLAWLVYRFRDALRMGCETVVSPLGKLYRRLQASDEAYYRKLVASRAISLTVPAHVAPLDTVFVEPELLSPPPLPQSASEIEPVPLAPRVLPLHRILGEHPQLVILGASGTGRTTLLAHLVLVCARATSDEKSPPAETDTTPELLQERLPLYVSLPAMNWDETDLAREQNDGLARLTRAALAAGESSSGMLRLLRQRLQAGQAIVLADGWDELLPQQRQRAATWLADLVAALPGNLWLVGAGTRGYAPLTEAGFVPLTLVPWDTGQVETFARQWVDACPPADEPAPVVTRELAAALWSAARVGSCPLELSLRAFVHLADGQSPDNRADLFDRAMGLLLWREPEGEISSSATYRAALGQVALSLQQERRATAGREEIEAAIEAALPPSGERPTRAVAHAWRTLTGESGLFRPVGGHRYAFTHPLWQAYLAARQLVAAAPASLVEYLDDPRWADVLRFYAELGDMGPLVAAHLRRPDDMFHTRLHTLCSWISVAPEGAAWREVAMRTMAHSFLQPDQPAMVRQALAEALAVTNVPGIIYLFKQALQHPNAEVRAAAILGLAKIAGEADLPDFEAMLADEALPVRQASVRGLAYLHIDAATRLLEWVLLEGDETLKPVAAQVLAERGEEGVAFLSEAAESEDVMVRRAVVLGLEQAGAYDLLEKMAREDEQWIVRSGALAALTEIEEQEKQFGVAPLPEIEQLPWLITWAAAQGTGVGVGDAARQMLRRALSEGDTSVRLAAVQVLAQTGRPADVEPLRAALADPDPIVASTALEALAEVNRRHDLIE